MSLVNDGSGLSAADVAAVCGNNGLGGWGNDGSWWVILFLFALMGNGFGGGFGGWGGGSGILNQDTVLYPYMLNSTTQNDVNRGFDNANISGQLNGIQTSINNGFANLEVANCNRAMDAMQTAYNNQIASMNQNFANQQALDNRLYAMQTAQQDCCCENRLATAQTQNIIQSEASTNRYENANNTRDIVTNATANTQAILDKLCQLELDAKNDKITDLERQLTMANFNASQVAQTAEIQRGQVAEVDALYTRLSNCPVPSMPVYGNQPIFNNTGTPCGCSGSF